MKIFKSTLLAFVAIFAMTSCNSDDPKQTVQYGFSNDFSYVTDLNAGTTQSLEGAQYIMDFDLVNGTVNIDVTNLRLTLGGTPIRLKLENVAYTQNAQTGAVVVNVPNAVSIIGGTTHNLSNFKLSQSTAYIAALGQTAIHYTASFTVDNQYSVTAVQQAVFLPGTTTYTSPAGEPLSQSNRSYYSYVLNREKSTATVTAYALELNSKYYTQLTFEDLPYTVSSTGISINFQGEITAKQPMVSATPFTATAISMDARYDTSTQIRILTDEGMLTASLSYRPASAN
ncbi:MAG: hypothetical protein NC230_09655 [Bacteroides sp.]|nr:hypothetical protein [Bacteroides sp.]